MKKMRGRTLGKRIINNRFRFILGMVAIFGASGVVAETISFHSDFDEATLGAITGLNIDTPSTSGPDSGTITLDTANDQLALTANAANMWTDREGAPIAWVDAPLVSVGETWFVETQINMVNNTGAATTYQQGGITFYGGPDGANPGDSGAFALVLSDWNGWVAQNAAIGVKSASFNSDTLTETDTSIFLRTEITAGVGTDVYNFFYKENAEDEWTQITAGSSVDREGSFDNSRVGLVVKSHNNNANGAAQFDYLTVGVVAAADGASLVLAPAALSLDLVVPDTSVIGTITANYVAGAVTSNDITIVSALADAGFTATVNNSIGLVNPNEDITVTYDNSGIGLENGESTNSTLVVTWTEVGSGVTQTSEAALSVTYINEPSSLNLTPATLSLILTTGNTSVKGSIAASFVAGSLSNDVEIVSVVPADSDFSAVPASFTLGSGNTEEQITVTYTNPGDLANKVVSTLVVTWTEVGSGVTNTSEVALNVIYTLIPANTLVAYDFDALSNPNYASATVVDENLTAGEFTDHMGAAFVPTIGDNSGVDASGDFFGTTVAPDFEGCVGIGVNDATTDSFTNAVAAGEYVSFTVNPMDGFVLNLTDISFKASKTAETSVDEYGVTLSDDVLIGSSATITTIGQEAAYEGVIIDLSAAEFQNITETTEFRIYAWGRDTTATGGTLSMLDKVVLKGSVGSGEIPPFSVAVSDGLLIMAWDTSAPYNVLTNINLVHGEWGVSQTDVVSPVTNIIGNADQVFYKLGK